MYNGFESTDGMKCPRNEIFQSLPPRHETIWGLTLQATIQRTQKTRMVISSESKIMGSKWENFDEKWESSRFPWKLRAQNGNSFPSIKQANRIITFIGESTLKDAENSSARNRYMVQASLYDLKKRQTQMTEQHKSFFFSFLYLNFFCRRWWKP